MLFGLAVFIYSAEHLDFTGVAFGDEDVAVRGGAQQARISQSAGIELDFETGQSLRPGVGRTRNQAGVIVGRLGGVGLGQVGNRELAARARLFRAIGGERVGAGEHGAC